MVILLVNWMRSGFFFWGAGMLLLLFSSRLSIWLLRTESKILIVSMQRFQFYHGHGVSYLSYGHCYCRDQIKGDIFI